MLKPVEKQRVAEEITEQLRSLILTGQYPPGSKLPPERELSKRLKVNRASLREALKKLEHLGLVRIRQGDGTRVTELHGDRRDRARATPAADRRRQARHDPRPARVPSHLRARDGASSRRARGKDSVAKMRAVADRADAAATTLELFELDFEFYVALAQLTGNQVMLLLINTVRDGVRGFMPLLANLAFSGEAVRKHHRDDHRCDREAATRSPPAAPPTTTSRSAPI